MTAVAMEVGTLEVMHPREHLLAVFVEHVCCKRPTEGDTITQ